MIPYGRQDISQIDIESVVEVLRSDFLTQGSQIPRFEKTIADYCHVERAVAANSATSALHVACLALGLSDGDWLWTTPNTFVASANCGIYCGARVDFVDINPQTYNLCVEELEKKLVNADKENKLPKVVIPVHFAGQSCDMKRIYELSLKYGFRIIEDASHAIGGKYLGRPIGSCHYSDITVFSFHPVKIITTGEGGIATTNDKDLANRMELFRSHGVSRDPQLMERSEGDWYYEQIDLGLNYRMTDIQAALGVSQMTRLEEFVSARHDLQERYDLLLKDLPVICPFQSGDSYSSLHLYPIQLKLNELKVSRAKIFRELRVNGVGVNVHYIPVHTHPFYKSMGFENGDFPNAEAYYSRAISIPIFQTLDFPTQDKIVDVLERVLQ